MAVNKVAKNLLLENRCDSCQYRSSNTWCRYKKKKPKEDTCAEYKERSGFLFDHSTTIAPGGVTFTWASPMSQNIEQGSTITVTSTAIYKEE